MNQPAPYVPQPQQGYPQQAQQQAPPQFNTPYQQPAQAQAQPGSGPVTQEQFTSLANTLQAHAAQLANLTGAVNGLGANQEALHQWLVSQAQNLSGMVGSISEAIRTEGAMGFLRSIFTQGPQAQQPQQQPQQQLPQGFPPQG